MPNDRASTVIATQANTGLAAESFWPGPGLTQSISLSCRAACISSMSGDPHAQDFEFAGAQRSQRVLRAAAGAAQRRQFGLHVRAQRLPAVIHRADRLDQQVGRRTSGDLAERA
ncbi:hypothetical protein NMQ14_10260 [Methyloversatilis sp. XJ19-13]|uniref:hypothetical protein n=1 Tax=Methyloversatilis sp. XJ19-13 TaxID=2963430 RepID=UPI00211CBA61|nr:hypothetical protein [Methyloversatilis sp. XJ19-13]MCQ9374632.1 hypothetical protein [Methyloversatilis sp. XJ19-13]